MDALLRRHCVGIRRMCSDARFYTTSLSTACDSGLSRRRRQTDRQIDWQWWRHVIDRQTNRPTDRQSDRQTHTDWYTVRGTKRQTNRQTDRLTDIDGAANQSAHFVQRMSSHVTNRQKQTQRATDRHMQTDRLIYSQIIIIIIITVFITIVVKPLRTTSWRAGQHYVQ